MQKYGATMATLAGLSAVRALIRACRPPEAQVKASGWMEVFAPHERIYPDHRLERMVHGDPPEPTGCRFRAAGGPAIPAAGNFVFEGPEYRRISQLLEVGGGTGLLASLTKQYHSHLKITVFDTAERCDAALELFRENSESQDLGAHAGDYWTDPFPSGFEAIQFSRILDFLDETQVLLMLAKACRALQDGGQLLVYARIPADRKPGRPAEVTGHRVEDYLAWLARAGFRRPTSRACSGSHVLLTGTR